MPQQPDTAATAWPEYRDVCSIPSSALAVISFGEPVDGSLITIPLSQPGQRRLAEVWSSPLRGETGSQGGVRFVTAGEMLLGALELTGIGDAVEKATREAFLTIIGVVRSNGFPHLLRMWNHVPRINEETGGLERYRAFSVGRHRAFSESGYQLREDLPAASAVGTRADGLWIYFVASRGPGRQIENPRQMRAYEYPSCYGPKSPSFSRATLKEWTSEWQLFLSGTASIVGHETLHEGNLLEQNAETWRNIDEVVRGALVAASSGKAGLRTLKVYLRDASDHAAIEPLIRERVGPEASVLYLEADICRRDLLIEIEGVFRMSNVE